MTFIPPARRMAPEQDNPTRSPHEPASDPRNKTGVVPPEPRLQDDRQAQRDGRAISSAVRNANTPGPTEPSRNTTRDPTTEMWTP